MAGVCSGNGPCDVHPTGHGGDNFVTRGGGFDPYLRAIINALKRKGHSESQAVQIAIGTVQRWARGEGNVSAATRARAAKSLAHWEALKAKAHADLAWVSTPQVDAVPWKGSEIHTTLDLAAAKRHLISTVDQSDRIVAAYLIDLAADPVFATNDGPNLTVPAGGSHRYHHGWVLINASQPTAVERAARAVSTDGHALLHGMGMVPAAQRVIERVKAAGHRVTVKRVDVGGRPHLHIAKTSSADLTASTAATVDLAFTEQLHPRAPKGTTGGGRFAPKNSSSSSSAPPSNMAANVRDFQRRNHLPVTGVIDGATAAKIHATLTAKGGGSGKGRKTKAARATARAQKQAIATHVATVNAMTPAQRATARNRMPTPPTGYVWTPANQLRRFHA